jgi:3-dehydro-4-phosphotetronate decarboxylase
MAMNESQLRHEICRVGRSLFQRGYVHATAGNISALLPESEGGGFLITPTDACLGFLEPDQLARLDATGQQISGHRASKTLALHRQIYEASAQTASPAQCVIHTHSSHCVALSLEKNLPQELLPALTPYFVMKVGHVPLIGYHRPGDPAAAKAVAQKIEQYAEQGLSIRAVILARLGPNVWHESPAQAMATLEELEETARLWHMQLQRCATASLALPEPLEESAIEELRQSFGAQW